MLAEPAFQIELAAYSGAYAVALVVTVLFALVPRSSERRTHALRVLAVLLRRKQRR